MTEPIHHERLSAAFAIACYIGSALAVFGYAIEMAFEKQAFSGRDWLIVATGFVVAGAQVVGATLMFGSPTQRRQAWVLLFLAAAALAMNIGILLVDGPGVFRLANRMWAAVPLAWSGVLAIVAAGQRDDGDVVSGGLVPEKLADERGNHGRDGADDHSDREER